MPCYRIDLSWDGTRYCGWQRQPQPKNVSIQEIVEDALQVIFPAERIFVQAAGRTDSGVHALQQVASFSVQHPRSPSQIFRGLNSKLPEDIVCINVQEVEDGFHPRHQSKEKLYRYRILHRALKCPFRRQYTWHISKPLDVQQMQDAAMLFIGTHDFTAFRAQKCSAASTVRTIVRAECTVVEDEIHFEVQGKGFLRHMVRIMMGAVVAVGQGRLTVEDIRSALKNGQRSNLGVTAPAHGLCLVWTSLLDKGREIE